MKDKTTRPPTSTAGQALTTTDTNQSLPPRKLKKNTKKYRVLNALMSRSYNRFEAAAELHDHALHSTVSSIQQTLGVRVDRRTEVVPGYQGAPTHVCRYWISPDQHQQANAVLGKTAEVE